MNLKTHKLFTRPYLNKTDFVFLRILFLLACVAFLMILGIFWFLFEMSLPVLKEVGIVKLLSFQWNPALGDYGILPFVYGTLMSSCLALLMATPMSIAAALFITEIAPSKISKPFGFLIELLAAIPSVVYGLWGLFVLVPWIRNVVHPFFKSYFSWIPWLQGPSYGIGLVAAGMVLAIMITPTITAICKEVFGVTPQILKEGVLALGSTQAEMIQIAVIGSGHKGILGAMGMGLARALGETMAVTMVIGNNPEILSSIFSPHQTMASVIASEVTEAHGLHLSSLGVVGLVLLVIPGFIFGFTRYFLQRRKKR